MGNTVQVEGEEFPAKVSTTDIVYRCIVEHRETGRVASRSTIQQATGLPLTIIDDRIKHLKAVGQIRLAGNVAGVFEPTEDRNDDRPQSVTYLPNGRVKYEIGDAVLEMSQREARHAGVLFGGFALQFRGA